MRGMVTIIFLMLVSFKGYSAGFFLFTDLDNSFFLNDFKGGGFNTPYILEPVTFTSTPQVREEIIGLKKIEITETDWIHLTENQMLAPQDGHIVYSSEYYTLQNGEKIKPGYFRITPETFKYFREGVMEEGMKKKPNWLLHFYKEGKKTGRPMFDENVLEIIRFMLNHEELRFGVGSLSMRGHSLEEMEEFWLEFQKDYKTKYIPDLNPQTTLTRNVTSNQPYAIIGPHDARGAELKKQYLEDVITQNILQADPVNDELIWTPNGKEKRNLTTIVMIENDQKYLKAIDRLFGKLSSEVAHNAKLMLVGVSKPRVKELMVPAKTGFGSYEFRPEVIGPDIKIYNGHAYRTLEQIHPEEFFFEGFKKGKRDENKFLQIARNLMAGKCNKNWLNERK